MADRYKLLKEILVPGYHSAIIPAGYEVQTQDGKIYVGATGWTFMADVVEGNLDWFQKIEEKTTEEEIRIIFFKKNSYINNRKIFDYVMGQHGITHPHQFGIIYTSEDLTQARIDAFNAARVFLFTPKNPQEQDRIVEMAKFYIENLLKYKFAGDYLQSLNNK